MKREFIKHADAANRHGIPESVLRAYMVLRELPDGTLCGMIRLLFHYSIQVGIDETGYRRSFCFADYATDLEVGLALLAYDGGDDMPGLWVKDTQRRLRRNPLTGTTWNEDENEPINESH